MHLLPEPLCLLSDVHIGHPATVLDGAESLAALFEGARTVVFNGDSAELRFLEGRERGLAAVAALSAEVRRARAEPVFVNGNHDPALSRWDHLDLCGGAVLATHGDLLYHEIAPWGRDAAFLARHHEAALAMLDGEDLADFEARLRANKQASMAYELHEPHVPRGPLARILTHMEILWPPWRPVQLARVWAETPGMAAALAERYRPHARFVLFGHTHWAGIWERRGRVVVNTGGFLSVLGRLGVWIDQGWLEIRSIVVQNGSASWGRVVRRFPITPFSRDPAS